MSPDTNVRIILDDGILPWFNGPEWDVIATEAFAKRAPDIESYAKNNAPWDDRTGAARNGLTAEVNRMDGTISLDLFHTVDYGQWLEVIQNGRFAVILPTLEKFAKELGNNTAVEMFNSRKGRG